MSGSQVDADVAQEMVRVQEAIHRDPELALQTPTTQEVVLRALAGLPLEVSAGTGSTSVTAVLRGGAGPDRGSRRSVLLRADMDAVPVSEATGLAAASRRSGAMHACGHDLHTAMLIGAAHLLCRRRDELEGDVVLMFQPGEEGWEGAQVMLDEGVLEASGTTVSAALALHVFSAGHASGQFFSRPGPMMASSAALDVVVGGRGGHASTPHLARDPIAACAEMITSLYVMASREIDALDPLVLTVGVVAAGSARNVIPDQARFEATLRTFSPTTTAAAAEAVRRRLGGIAAGHGVEVEVDLRPLRPVTVNDAGEHEIVEALIARELGADRHARLERAMTAAEDFSRVLERVPGTFVGLGAVAPGLDPATAASNHSPRAVFDTSVMPDGARLMAAWAHHRLRRAPRDVSEHAPVHSPEQEDHR